MSEPIARTIQLGGKDRNRYNFPPRAINSAARVPALHAGSQGFESLIAHSHVFAGFRVGECFLLDGAP